MKRLLLIFCAMFALSTAWAVDTIWTDPETNIKWRYQLLDDGTVKIGSTYINKVAIDGDFEGELVIPEKINGYSLTSIGNYSFYNFTKLTSVTIPEGVTEIESGRAFYSCDVLTSVVIPESMTAIGARTFSNSVSLKSINFPSALKTIGTAAFQGCSGISSLTLPDGVSLSENAFYDCKGITTLILPANITTSLHPFTNVAPINLTAMASYGMDLSRLTNLTIPNGATSIPDATFKNAKSLMSISIPSTVTSIGSDAFLGCSGLPSIIIPENILSIGSTAFSGCSGAKLVVIPLTMQTIGTDAFKFVKPTTLSATHLQAGLEGTNLTTVIIPDGATTIPANAFKDCTALTTVTIPASVKVIEDSAFAGCTALTNIIFEGEPPTLGNDVFPCVSAMVTYKGEYAKKWDLQANSGSWGTLSFSSEDVPVYTTIIGAGTITTPAEDGIVEYFPKGEIRALTATATEGYIFMGWSGDVVSLESTITLTSEDVERYQLTALFLPKALIKAVAKEMAEDEKLTSDTDVETIISNKVTAGDLVSKAQAQTDVEGLISDKLKSGELVSRSDAKADAKTEANTVVDEKVVSKELVTKQQIKDLSMKTPVIDVTSGSGTLSLTLQKSTNLSDEEAWKDVEVTNPSVDANGNVTIDITPKEDEDTAFYKFVVKPEDQTK